MREKINYKDMSKTLNECLLKKIKTNRLKQIIPLSYNNIEEALKWNIIKIVRLKPL